MRTYADPTRCPDCGTLLPHAPESCPTCHLPLTGSNAGALFAALQEADRLLGVLRAAEVPLAVPVGAPAPSPTTLPVTEERGLLAGATPYPQRPRSVPTRATRLTGASVPRILLSLGALCLIVAAVAFLAVAWAWLGVGGRTLVLAGLTAGAFAVATLVARRGLRTACEAITLVGLGLLALDVVGARHAGWLGHLDGGRLVLLVGAVVGCAALAALALTAQRPLVGPAVVAPLAILLAGFGAQADVENPAPLAVTALLLLAVGRLGTVLPSVWLRVTSLGAFVAAWALLVVIGLVRLGEHPTVGHLWGHAAVWPLVAATGLAAAAGPAVGGARRVGVVGFAVATLLGSYVCVLPALDNGATSAVMSVLPLVLLWSAALLLVEARLRPVALVPLLGALVGPVVAVADLAGTAARGLFGVGQVFSVPFGVRIIAAPADLATWLMVPAALVAAAGLCAVATRYADLPRPASYGVLGAAGLLAGVATLPLHNVRLYVVVAALVALAAGALVAAERLAGRSADLPRVAAVLLLALATSAALPSSVMSSLVLLVTVVASAVLAFRDGATGAVAMTLFPIAFGGLVWSSADVAGVHEIYRAVPVLLVLGAACLWRARGELEGSSLLTGAVVSAAAVLDANDLYAAVAVHLTVAGVLVTASSIVHPARRSFAWLGGLLLAAATWVRLADLGVHVPEAYTLPSALVLVVVGAWHVHRDDDAATVSALAPGLALATVPSLLLALEQPTTLRSALLGAGCLVLVLAGLGLRWSAPLVIGGAVGAALVLRELAPYAATVPVWVQIGTSGLLLTAVGITWEARMRDLRSAARYVGALR